MDLGRFFMQYVCLKMGFHSVKTPVGLGLLILSVPLSACRPSIDDNLPETPASTQPISTADLADGSVTPVKLSQAYLLLAGGTITGKLNLTHTPTEPNHAATKDYIDGAITTLSLAKPLIPVRQTVLAGSTNAITGLPDFLSIQGSSIALFASATPLVLSWAEGFGSSGQIDYIEQISADNNSAWSGLAASSTLYLYIQRNSTGDLSYGTSSYVPVYSAIAPTSPSTGQHWFDVSSYRMKYWDGTSWISTLRLFVGECTTNGTGTPTIVTAYALRGKSIARFAGAVGAQNTTLTHALGTTSLRSEFFLTCTAGQLAGQTLYLGGYHAIYDPDGRGFFLSDLNTRTAAWTKYEQYGSYLTFIQNSSGMRSCTAGTFEVSFQRSW